MQIEKIQAAVRAAGVGGWLFYDFRRSNPIAHRVLGLPEQAFFTRRWCYFVPARGEPVKLVSAVESHVLTMLPGRQFVYRSWHDFREMLSRMVAGAHNVAMEYVPNGDNPYCSRVDAGIVEMVRSLGPAVTSSADFAQQFEAALSPAQIASHRAAGRALLQAREALFAWLRPQFQSGATLSEYAIQQQFTSLMRDAGLDVPEDEQPLVAVNGNAANPHYAPTAERHSPVRTGDVLLLDFSARMPGADSIFADYTWMTFIGERVPDFPANLFAVIRDARDTGTTLLRDRFTSATPVQGFEVDDAVRAVVSHAGYGEAFVHRTGHNIGTFVHGNGAHLDNLETHDTRRLIANTCTSVEPGIYLPDQNVGVRTEVDVLLLDGSIEVTGVPAQTEIEPLLA